jgi:hypothetical protein
MQMYALPFNYRKKEYHSVVRVKHRNEETKLEVTILDSDLEWTLYGYHVFTICDGCINCKKEAENQKVKELQSELKNAIEGYFEKHRIQVA